MAQNSLSDGIEIGLHPTNGYVSDDPLSVGGGSSGTFIGTQYQQWVHEHYHYAFFISIAYLIAIYVGQWYMKGRKAYDLKPWLTAWNSGLAVFSIMGSYHMVPEFFETWREHGLAGTYCVRGNQFNGKPGLWYWLFLWSKLFELVDTAFLVLRKRPVVFLHSYHHAVVLAVSPFHYRLGPSFSRYGAVMNLVVHSFMYTYYALRAAGFRVHKFVSMSITFMQLSQMIIATTVCITVLNTLYHGIPCETDLHVALLQLAQYFSFFVLFGKLFIDMYISKSAKNKKLA